MGRHRGGVDAEQIGDLLLFPVEPVDQHHGHSLPVRQLGECRGKRWLDFRRVGDRDRWKQESSRRMHARPTDPIQIPDGVLHRFDPLPMLPSVGQGLRRRICPEVLTNRRRQRDTKPWLGVPSKPGKRFPATVSQGDRLATRLHTQ